MIFVPKRKDLLRLTSDPSVLECPQEVCFNASRYNPVLSHKCCNRMMLTLGRSHMHSKFAVTWFYNGRVLIMLKIMYGLYVLQQIR